CLQMSTWSTKYGQLHHARITSSPVSTQTVYDAVPRTSAWITPFSIDNERTAPDWKYEDPCTRDRCEIVWPMDSETRIRTIVLGPTMRGPQRGSRAGCSCGFPSVARNAPLATFAAAARFRPEG